MEAFPAFFPLTGARVVIAGEGEGADAKARLLAPSPAKLERLTGAAALDAKSYAGAVLAFIVSPDAAFREGAVKAAKAAGAAVNVVDHPDLSDFHSPAIIDRGQVVAAIGTAGAAPMIAALLRAELEAKIPAGLGRVAELFGRLQSDIRAAFPDLAHRRAFLRAALDGPVGQAADAGNMDRAETLLHAQLAKGGAALGRIWLIVTPDARDLLSLRAARALAIADELALADGVDPAVAALARRDAHWRQLADTTAEDLEAAANAGRQAVVVAGAVDILGLAESLAANGVAAEVLSPAQSA
jgi:precorrin-2 dehydrogenase/sirohydrochlorin ferrochelatase